MPLYYYKYNFISPDKIYAQIEEEMNSYFSSGSLDNIMFPVWTSKCLDKLGRISYDVKEISLHIDNFSIVLPSDFKSVRELWVCNPATSKVYPSPVSEYRIAYHKTERIYSDEDKLKCGCSDDCDSIIKEVYKTTDDTIIRYYSKSHLMTPGLVNTRTQCSSGCPNLYSDNPDTFDIFGNKLVTNLRDVNLYLIYLSNGIDENNQRLIPEDHDIEDYIYKFIKFKLYNRLLDQATDETFNVLRYKYEKAEIDMNQAWIIARTSSMSESIQRKRFQWKRAKQEGKEYNLRDARPKRR